MEETKNAKPTSFWKNFPTSISRLYHMSHIMVIQQIIRLKLPDGCQLDYPGMGDIGEFILTIKPKEGFWKKGVFKFSIRVSENYGYQTPTVKCLTKIWHPAIDTNGTLMLPLEKTAGRAFDSPSGVSKIIDIIWEIYALFTEDPEYGLTVNEKALDMYKKNPKEFRRKVREEIKLHARD